MRNHHERLSAIHVYGRVFPAFLKECFPGILQQVSAWIAARQKKTPETSSLNECKFSSTHRSGNIDTIFGKKRSGGQQCITNHCTIQTRLSRRKKKSRATHERKTVPRIECLLSLVPSFYCYNVLRARHERIQPPKHLLLLYSNYSTT